MWLLALDETSLVTLAVAGLVLVGTIASGIAAVLAAYFSRAARHEVQRNGGAEDPSRASFADRVEAQLEDLRERQTIQDRRLNEVSSRMTGVERQLVKLVELWARRFDEHRKEHEQAEEIDRLGRQGRIERRRDQE